MCVASAAFSGEYPAKYQRTNAPASSFRHHECCAQHHQHDGDDDRHDALALGLFAALVIAVQNGDEGDGCGPAHQKVGDGVRQLEGRTVGVHLAARAKQVGGEFLPHQADDAGEKRRDHQQQGCRGCRMGMARPEHAKHTRDRAGPHTRIGRFAQNCPAINKEGIEGMYLF